MTLHGCTKSLKVIGFKATLATNCWVLRKLLVRPLARRMSIILTGPGINEQGNWECRRVIKGLFQRKAMTAENVPGKVSRPKDLVR
jgi:hypothetical protein